MTSSPKGSEWRKWDLHVHTPETKLANGYSAPEGTNLWDLFCEKIEASDVDVIGITDYFSIENYLKFKKHFSKKYPKSTKVFFPNVELRLDVSVNRDAEEINLHVIFDNDPAIEPKIVEFLADLKTNIQKGTTGTYHSCSGLTTTKDYQTAAVTQKDIKASLQKAFGKTKPYFIVAAVNAGGIRASGSPRKLNISDEIDDCCDFFFGGSQNRDWFLTADRFEDKTVEVNKKSVLAGSDAHSFADLDAWLGKAHSSKGHTKEVTWIKADTTFEGLKQVTYEPEHRISIQENRPVAPINKIENISLNFPKAALVGGDKFCLAGQDETFELSPYLNCFIGGRGSGKSTILSLLGLQSRYNAASQAFWKNLQPSFNLAKNPEYFAYEGTADFEFISQNEIEEFAKDKEKFTDAIFQRSKLLLNDSEFEEWDNDTTSLKEKLDEVAAAILRIEQLVNDRQKKEDEKKTLQKVIDAISSPEYIEASAKNSDLSKEVSSLSAWDTRIETLKTKVSTAISDLEKGIKGIDKPESGTLEATAKGLYDDTIEGLRTRLETLRADKTQKSIGVKVKELKGEIEKNEQIIQKILAKNGLSEENINQAKTASQRITQINREIKEIDNETDELKTLVATQPAIVESLAETKVKYEGKIQTGIAPLQKALETEYNTNKGADIKSIDLIYYFDEETCWHAIGSEFYEYFSDFEPSYNKGERSTEVIDFIVKNRDAFSKNTRKDVCGAIDGKKAGKLPNYIEFLDGVFQSEDNLKIFRTIRDKHLYDVGEYKRIEIRYDKKGIEQASFGQRCTAAIVVLLLFGNHPIIIDEPEAHLDSSLIANYLVPLIKSVKRNRQIIFATHNANFVVNGDSEKIFVLKNDGMTTIVETTIENLDNREELLKLEGGKDAFEKRGEKLNLK